MKNRQFQWVSVFEALMAFALVIGLAIWSGGAYPNRDPLWFYEKFDAQPYKITVYSNGTAVDLYRGDAGYERMLPVINSSVVKPAGFLESFYPSDSSLDSYRNSGVAVELAYQSPVKIHTKFFFPQFDHLFVPLDGTYNYLNEAVLFRALNGKWGGTALILSSTSEIRAAADAILESQ